MEDKQLNFNRPFLSVRRFSPSASAPSVAEDKRKTNHSLPDRSHIPVYKSDIVSGPLRNPGTVPFTWEKSPGRPKNEEKRLTKGQERPPLAPKLPPGRPLNPKQTDSDKEDSNSSTDNLKLENRTSKDKAQEATSKVEDDDDETYFEAQDILSRSESFFNCSISGLSGLDGTDSSLSGRFSTDSSVQDFMMDRFLPAAKAMTSETPPHPLPKKQPVVVQQQPKVIKKSVNINQQHPLYHYRPGGVSPHYGSEPMGIQTVEDDEFEPKSSSMKVCGLLPRFLLKSSICILDPVQGIGMQEKTVSSVRRAKTSTGGECGKKHGGDVLREQLHPHRIETSAKSKSIEPNQFIDKIGSAHADSAPEEDNGMVGNSEIARGKGCLNFRELLATEGDEWKANNSGPVVERTLYIDSVRHTKSVSSDSNNAEEQSSNQILLLETNGVDDDKVKEAPFIDSLPQDIKFIDFMERNEVSSKYGSRDSFDSGLLFDSIHHDVKDIGVVEDSNLCAAIDANLSQEDHIIKKDSRTSNKFHSNGTHLDRIFNGNRLRNHQESHEKITRREIARDTAEKEDGGGDKFLKFLVPPSLPKSPTESWLLRTLPSVSSKNTSRWSPMSQQECDRNQISKSPSIEPKWESIVKSSNSYHHHQFRPPQELLEPIPES